MSDFVDKFDKLYLPKLGARAPTFRAVIREAVARGVRTIIETGCTRKEDNWLGDGQSTVIWNDYCCYNMISSFTSIDIDQTAIDLAAKLAPNAVCICADSVTELAKPNGGIDLLYLDSFDLDIKDPRPAAMHCMFEFCSARPRLKSGSIVFIDDTPYNEGKLEGKGMYVARYFNHLGVHPFTMGCQAAWVMP